MQIVKLGGSFITAKRKKSGARKQSKKIFYEHRVKQIAGELKQSPDPLILINGAGSFGHIKAEQYKLDKVFTGTEEQRRGVVEVSSDVRELNLKLVRALASRGILCMPVPPSTTVTKRNKKISSIELSYYKNFIKKDLTPISFGDLVYDSEKGITICSGDDIMYELAREFSPTRAVFVMDEDGVFDKNPKEYPDAELITKMTKKKLAELKKQQGQKKGSDDATGGILGKAEICLKIRKLGVECMIINGKIKGRLKEALNGKKVVGTYF